MIRLTFMVQVGINPELIKVEIENKAIRYYDKIWVNGVQLLPSDSKEMKMIEREIIMSRNKKDTRLLEKFILKKEDKKEYEGAKDDEELARITIKDCELKGLKLIGEEKI